MIPVAAAIIGGYIEGMVTNGLEPNPLNWNYHSATTYLGNITYYHSYAFCAGIFFPVAYGFPPKRYRHKKINNMVKLHN